MVGSIEAWKTVKLPNGRVMQGAWQYGAHGGEVEFESIVIAIYDDADEHEWRIFHEETGYLESGAEHYLETAPSMEQLRKDYTVDFNELKDSYLQGDILYDVDTNQPVSIKSGKSKKGKRGRLTGPGRGWHGDRLGHVAAARKGKYRQAALAYKLRKK